MGTEKSLSQKQQRDGVQDTRCRTSQRGHRVQNHIEKTLERSESAGREVPWFTTATEDAKFRTSQRGGKVQNQVKERLHGSQQKGRTQGSELVSDTTFNVT